MCTSIWTAPRNRPEGLARFCPARRGAEPWIASNIDTAADVGAAGEADRARDLRGHVGEDVAVEVRQDHDVERLGGVGQLGGADVDDPVLGLDLGVLGSDLLEHLVEETVGHLHDVVLGEAGDLLAVVAAGVLEGVADDALAAGSADELEALVDLVGLAVLDAGVEVLFVLADDHHVHAGCLVATNGL
jgi:hypothetical protein